MPPTRELPRLAGTYALLIRVAAPLVIEAGRLGAIALAPGWVVYTGSAHGPGGLLARVSRHRRAEKKPRWHIDALTLTAPVTAVWAAVAPERLECRWAAALTALPGASLPARGFGASDCGCPAHLIRVIAPDAIPGALAATTRADVLLY
ncbi:MAG: GIY-YIG nuclease family protein [Anaerolineae bacterium]|nr:GIY-YIG nuclease family protein [Anaerolineae bacterium]